MKFMQVLILLFFASTAFAENYMIFDKIHVFKEKDEVLLYGCDKKCSALDSIKKFKTIKLDKYRKPQRYANSLGSDVCSFVYNGGSILGQAENKDRRAFCLFKDGSMIEINSLTSYLRSKKIVR